jgi:hypothetical protein
MGLQGIEVHRLSLCECRTRAWLKTKKPELSTQLNALISNAEVGTHLLVEGPSPVSACHSITSSALLISEAGRTSPRVAAALRLRKNSTFVTRCTGN